MAKKTLTERIKAQLEEATTELKAAQASSIYWQAQVTERETEVARLQGALDSLEGKPPAFSVDLKAVSVTTAEEAAKGAPIYKIGGAIIQTIDGVEYAIEPGYYATKNKRGDVVIIPIGTRPNDTDETLPIMPARKTAVALPAAEAFDSPESLI